MNAIRPSDPKVPVLPQYYVYSADNNHVGPVSAEITAESLARLGLSAGRPVYASFKATGTRVVAEQEAPASSA